MLPHPYSLPLSVRTRITELNRISPRDQHPAPKRTDLHDFFVTQHRQLHLDVLRVVVLHLHGSVEIAPARDDRSIVVQHQRHVVGHLDLLHAFVGAIQELFHGRHSGLPAGHAQLAVLIRSISEQIQRIVRRDQELGCNHKRSSYLIQGTRSGFQIDSTLRTHLQKRHHHRENRILRAASDRNAEEVPHRTTEILRPTS